MGRGRGAGPSPAPATRRGIDGRPRPHRRGVWPRRLRRVCSTTGSAHSIVHSTVAHARASSVHATAAVANARRVLRWRLGTVDGAAVDVDVRDAAEAGGWRLATAPRMTAPLPRDVRQGATSLAPPYSLRPDAGGARRGRHGGTHRRRHRGAGDRSFPPPPPQMCGIQTSKLHRRLHAAGSQYI
jgi:hypothetical protein